MKRIKLDELYLSMMVPNSLEESRITRIRMILRSPRFVHRLKTAIRRLVREYPMSGLTVRLSR